MQSKSTLGGVGVGGEKKRREKQERKKPTNVHSNTNLQNTKKQRTGFRRGFFSDKNSPAGFSFLIWLILIDHMKERFKNCDDNEMN